MHTKFQGVVGVDLWKHKILRTALWGFVQILLGCSGRSAPSASWTAGCWRWWVVLFFGFSFFSVGAGSSAQGSCTCEWFLSVVVSSFLIACVFKVVCFWLCLLDSGYFCTIVSFDFILAGMWQRCSAYNGLVLGLWCVSF